MTTTTGGERPANNRTPQSPTAWVARIGLVSPAEQAGALPLHDTTPAAGIDWTFTPTRPPAHTLHPVTDTRHEAKTPESPAIVDTDRLTRTVGQAVAQATWSLALSAVSLWLVWLAGQTSGSSTAVEALALAAIAVCGGLLIVAHAITSRRTR